MKKSVFLNELKDALMDESDNFTQITPIHLTSLTTLSVIALIDENFDKQVRATDLKNVATPHDLMHLIGINNFEE